MPQYSTLSIKLWIDIIVLLINVRAVKGQDGNLKIKDLVWTNGQPIEIICQLKETSLQGCNGTLTETIFRNSAVQMCIVDVSWESKCLNTSPSVSPAQCWCERNSSGYVNYVYRFWADYHAHTGNWTCEKSCEVIGKLAPVPFKINTTDGLNRVVTDNLKEPTQTCDRSSDRTALVLPERKEAVYIDCKQPVPDTCNYLCIIFATLFSFFVIVSVVFIVLFVLACKGVIGGGKRGVIGGGKSGNAVPDNASSATATQVQATMPGGKIVTSDKAAEHKGSKDGGNVKSEDSTHTGSKKGAQ